jgi:hypothetical protein
VDVEVDGEASRQLDIAIDWGRKAELFGFEDDDEGVSGRSSR